jgi:hypothetical protein
MPAFSTDAQDLSNQVAQQQLHGFPGTLSETAPRSIVRR